MQLGYNRVIYTRSDRYGYIARQFHQAHVRLVTEVSSNFSELPELTKRQREVLCWIAAGKSNWDIGQILSISEHGVDFHVRNIFKKLGVNSRVVAVARASQLGLFALG